MNDMQKSIERLRNSQVVPDFQWWDGKVFIDLADQVEKVGTKNARVRMFQGLREDGLPEVWFDVVSASAVTLEGGGGGGTNESHPCPPLC